MLYVYSSDEFVIVTDAPKSKFDMVLRIVKTAANDNWDLELIVECLKEIDYVADVHPITSKI